MEKCDNLDVVGLRKTFDLQWKLLTSSMNCSELMYEIDLSEPTRLELINNNAENGTFFVLIRLTGKFGD